MVFVLAMPSKPVQRVFHLDAIVTYLGLAAFPQLYFGLNNSVLS